MSVQNNSNRLSSGLTDLENQAKRLKNEVTSSNLFRRNINPSSTPITPNRFNNQAPVPEDIPKSSIFYASGVPIDNNISHNIISSDNRVPYDGKFEQRRRYDQNVQQSYPNYMNRPIQIQDRPRTLHPPPRPLSRTSSTLPGVQFFGRPTQTYRRVSSPEECKNICLNNNQCNRWTHNNKNDTCQIRTGRPIRRSLDRDLTSGEIYSRR